MMSLFLIVFCLFKASASLSLHGDTTAEYGSDAHYRCALSNSTGVLQVTWQRFVKGTVEDMATYSERFGIDVKTPYRGKVLVTKESFSPSAIKLTNLTWEDESCLSCAFNIFPGGSKRSQICLKVQGISKVNTMHHAKQDGEVVFSCSATGKPAPTIEWDLSDGAAIAEEPQTVTVKNSDHTFNASSNITVKVPPGWRGHAACVLNRGKIGEREERIAFSSSASADGDEQRGPSPSAIALICITIIVCCIAVAVYVIKRSSRKHNQREGSCSMHA
ncbi:OX-2 membrane glycoprotein [Haplochromis burtoni]|uniref:OX-2 membrane glycoprotein n=1 Tax=Haplochromis burtoni TaxID=8153 RepID=UPI0003BC9530|nr:OX-2 membrane glycoprotein [Haplochromis burtoni]